MPSSTNLHAVASDAASLQARLVWVSARRSDQVGSHWKMSVRSSEQSGRESVGERAGERAGALSHSPAVDGNIFTVVGTMMSDVGVRGGWIGR